MKRVSIPELLDVDGGSPAQIASALTDLRHINSWFGGVRTTRLMVESVAQRLHTHQLALLEVAAGAGFVPQQTAKDVSQRGIELNVTLLDRAWSHLSNSNGNRSQKIAGDALALPFADLSFDLVSCCLFVHHLSPEEAVSFANEALRVCRHAVLINDLVRHPMHLAMAYASLPLYRSHITHHDAPASVRQAYSIQEMQSMLKLSSASRVEIEHRAIFRMGIILWK